MRKGKGKTESRLVDRINAAFDANAVPLSQRDSHSLSHSATATTTTTERPYKKRKVEDSDDGDDDVDFEMVETAAVVPPTSSIDDDGDGGGGGFLPEDDDVLGGGGFLPDDDALGGGFIVDSDDGGGGGFIVDNDGPTSTTSTTAPAIDLPSTILPHAHHSKPERIALHSIPAALEALSLPGDSHEVLMTFREIASDDEELGESVSRKRFLQVCEVLLSDSEGGDDDDDEDGDDGEVGDEGESGVRLSSGRGRGGRRTTSSQQTRGNDDTRPLRRSTRNRKQTSSYTIDDADDLASPRDPEDSDSLSSPLTSSQGEDESDDDFGNNNNRKSASKTRSSSSSSSKKTNNSKRADKVAMRAKNRSRVLSQEEVEYARDTFDLFLEGGGSGGGGARVIGLQQLRHVADLLGERLDDAELVEMLEYAGRGRGVVDFEAFSKVLAEAL